MTRSFALGDILTVATSVLVSPRHMDAVYDLCNFMTGDSLFTHQLPRACRECEPEIYRQHPDLRAIEKPDFTNCPAGQVETAVRAWLVEQEGQYGTAREIAPMPAEAHTRLDPFDELAMNYPHVKVLGVAVDGNR